MGYFCSTIARESTMGMRGDQKKKFKGFLMFFTLENFKNSLSG
jgi:hypothetical protein